MNGKLNPNQENPDKSYILVLIIAVVMLVFIVLGTKELVIYGIYSWASGTTEYRSMMIELLLWYVILMFCLLLPRHSAGKMTAVGITAAVFFWCHVVFWPIVAAGLYLLFICALGHLLNRFVCLETGFSVSSDFLLGCSFIITLFCAMSALGIGAIPNLRLAVGVLAVCLAVVYRKTVFSRQGRGKVFEAAVREIGPLDFRSKIQVLMLAFILLMFLLQAGRMNITLDFDTLWYSVRSEYMLDNGPKGIYENMGTVSLVYTYPKGWEILTLPLVDLPSHSFLLAFTLWITGLALFTAWRITKEYGNRQYALFVPFLMSSVPGIMNMGISGKTDNITFLVQLIFIHQIVLYLKNHRCQHLIAGLGAVLLSWTMKPTAIVFSTVICGASVLYLLFSRQFPLEQLRKERAGICRAAVSLVLFFSTLFADWFRTWLFVGVPVTSIFSGIFQKIGFTVRYPFLIWGLPGYGTKPTVMEAITQLLKRLWGVFLLPVDKEMNNVVVSWCSLAVLFFLLVWCASFFVEKEKPEPFQRHMIWCGRYMLSLLTLISIYSIYSLKKVDGNYYMLLYAVIIIFGFILVSRMNNGRFRRCVLLLLIPLTMFNVMMVSLSNWAWSVGFSPLSLIHRGYMDHEEQQHQVMVEKGNREIWDILAADPQTRVIAFGTHPGVLVFPCNVQSYVDISGSNGNELLVESLDAFREYLEYAKTDYIYVEAGNMAREYMGYQLLVDCIQEGILTKIKSENGNILAVVDLEGCPGREAEDNLRRFYEEYVMKESVNDSLN